MIIKSEIISLSPQADSRVYVRECHTDHSGGRHYVEHLAESGSDHSLLMIQRVPQLEAQLQQTELDRWLAVVRDGQPIPADGCIHVTRDQAMGYVFRSLAFDPDPQALYKASWMVPYFTDTELSALGFDATQITAIRTKSDILNQARLLLESVTPIEA